MKKTIEVNEHGTTVRRMNGELHCDDGPAIEWADGSKFWCKKGIYHREDGPAIEMANGKKEYWLNGLCKTDNPLVWMIMQYQNKSEIKTVDNNT